jgi:hypothetical protein
MYTCRRRVILTFIPPKHKCEHQWHYISIPPIVTRGSKPYFENPYFLVILCSHIFWTVWFSFFQTFNISIMFGEHRIYKLYLIILGGGTVSEVRRDRFRNTQHLHRIDLFFQRLRETGLKLSPKKCSFFMPKVRYVGHVVSKQRIFFNNKQIFTGILQRNLDSEVKM